METKTQETKPKKKRRSKPGFYNGYKEPLDDMASSRYHAMSNRCLPGCKNKDHCHKGGASSYKRKGIKVRFNGMKEFKPWFRKELERYMGRKAFASMCAECKTTKEISARIRTITIDRIDPSGDYCPENCRLVSASENSRRACENRKRDAAGHFVRMYF